MTAAAPPVVVAVEVRDVVVPGTVVLVVEVAVVEVEVVEVVALDVAGRVVELVTTVVEEDLELVVVRTAFLAPPPHAVSRTPIKSAATRRRLSVRRLPDR